jgi:hypothetical protein
LFVPEIEQRAAGCQHAVTGLLQHAAVDTSITKVTSFSRWRNVFPFLCNAHSWQSAFQLAMETMCRGTRKA